MVVTVAAITPVVAANTVPTITTARARPPRRRPISRPMVSSSRSAMPDCSSMAPMNTNAGIASRVRLPMIPKIRWGKAAKKEASMTPRATARAANTTATPPSPKATG